MDEYTRNIWLALLNGNKCSIAVGKAAYCTPRNNDGPYTTVEVGFPTGKIPDSWADYQDGGNKNHTVYGYLPIELLVDWIILNKD